MQQARCSLAAQPSLVSTCQLTAHALPQQCLVVHGPSPAHFLPLPRSCTTPLPVGRWTEQQAARLSMTAHLPHCWPSLTHAQTVSQRLRMLEELQLRSQQDTAMALQQTMPCWQVGLWCCPHPNPANPLLAQRTPATALDAGACARSSPVSVSGLKQQATFPPAQWEEILLAVSSQILTLS